MRDAVLARLNRAIASVCRAIDAGPRPDVRWCDMKEEDLAYHLCYGILSSGVKHEAALAACAAIREDGILSRGITGPWDRRLERDTKNVLTRPLAYREDARPIRYRFPDSRAEYLVQSFTRLYSTGDTLRHVLETSINGAHARARLIALAKGIGPKQASLFLRQIGFCESLAVLDTHILRYLSLALRRSITAHSVRRIEAYERLEEVFRNVARGFGYSTGDVDLAVWITVRVAARNAVL